MSQSMSIDKARRLIAGRLAQTILHLESEEPPRIADPMLFLFELIGYIRGRTTSPDSEECQILHFIKEAVHRRDLTQLWKLQDRWAEFRHAR